LNNKFNLTVKVLSVVAVISLCFALFFLAVDFFGSRGRFPANSFIGKVDVSGLDKAEAVQRIKTTPVPAAFEPMVYFNASGETFAYSTQELGIYIKAEESVNNALSQANRGNYVEGLQKRIYKEVESFPLILDAEPAVLQTLLEDLATKVESVAQNASISLDEKTLAYNIVEDFPGRKLDIKKSIDECRSRLNESKNTFSLSLDYYELPRVTEYALRSAPPVHKLASFTTYYGTHDSPNRIHNIKLIASWLDNTLLLSDESFSLVKAIGNFSPERGFKQAYVISGGVLVPEYGGGTCQIGTTLYNAVALADLNVISRRNHSFYFSIYPFGRDATVYPGSSDFRFQNNTGAPILLKAEATGRLLRFAVYGTPTGKKVEFSEPAVYSLTSRGFVPSNRWAVLRSNSPFRTIVIRKVYDKTGKLLKEETITSFYKLYGDGTNVPIKRREGL